MLCEGSKVSVHNTYKGIASETPNVHFTVYNLFLKCTQQVSGFQIREQTRYSIYVKLLSTSLTPNQCELRGAPSVTAEILTNSIRWEMVILVMMMDLAL